MGKNKKYNNESVYFKDWTNKKLKEEAILYDQMIYVNECYRTKDVIILMGICEELNKRGVDIENELSFCE